MSHQVLLNCQILQFVYLIFQESLTKAANVDPNDKGITCNLFVLQFKELFFNEHRVTVFMLFFDIEICTSPNGVG